jgi:hypothetical protein
MTMTSTDTETVAERGARVRAEHLRVWDQRQEQRPREFRKQRTGGAGWLLLLLCVLSVFAIWAGPLAGVLMLVVAVVLTVG